jgi:hypothetical protein
VHLIRRSFFSVNVQGGRGRSKEACLSRLRRRGPLFQGHETRDLGAKSNVLTPPHQNLSPSGPCINKTNNYGSTRWPKSLHHHGHCNNKTSRPGGVNATVCFCVNTLYGIPSHTLAPTNTPQNTPYKLHTHTHILLLLMVGQDLETVSVRTIGNSQLLQATIDALCVGPCHVTICFLRQV